MDDESGFERDAFNPTITPHEVSASSSSNNAAMAATVATTAGAPHRHHLTHIAHSQSSPGASPDGTYAPAKIFDFPTLSTNFGRCAISAEQSMIAPSHGMDAKTFLGTQTLGSLIYWKHPLCDIDANAHVDTALQRLQTNNLLSLPVFNVDKNEYVGLITVLDTMVFLAARYFDDNGHLVSAEDRKGLSSTEIGELVGTSDYFRGGGVWQENGLVILEPTSSLLSALTTMCLGVQRVLVRTTATGHREGMSATIHEDRTTDHRIVSQADVVKHLCEHNVFFLDAFAKTLQELGLDKPTQGRRVVSVVPQTSALEAFRTMFEENADAVAVVDVDGRLLSTLSASDLRGLRVGALADMTRPVGDFLARRHGGRMSPAVALRPDSTLLSAAVGAMICHVHRMWIVDEEKRPISMVRLVDVIKSVHAECVLKKTSTPTSDDGHSVVGVEVASVDAGGEVTAKDGGDAVPAVSAPAASTAGGAVSIRREE